MKKVEPSQESYPVRLEKAWRESCSEKAVKERTRRAIESMRRSCNG